jgi:CHAT domain-containing protein
VREVKHLGSRYRNVELGILENDSRQLGASDLEGFDLLHIAAHVEISNETPWRSEILLADRGHPGNLLAAQIADMDLSAHLVILSSCESAGGRVLAGEGVLGLSSAFLSAGVAAVVATLWPVDDKATEFRAELRRAPETSHPFYWAGFTLIGNGDLRLALEKRSHLARSILLVGCLLVLLAAVFAARRYPRE